MGPASQASRKSAQSRQFAFESELSNNNYASQISGWVNQSILAAHQQPQTLDMPDQSANSIKAKSRGAAKRIEPTESS